MMEPKISVIIPLFNTAMYLKECLNSLINQTYKNLEIIIVDDGSYDGSDCIADYFEILDRRIKVIHLPQKSDEKFKSYGSAGNARNIGLKCATGEYIGFVDSDDFCSNNMFERMITVARENNADLVRCTLNFYYKTPPQKQMVEKFVNSGFISKEEAIKAVLTMGQWLGTKATGGFSQINLYKRSLIDEYKLAFLNYSKWLHEDTFFNIQYILNCHNIMFLNEKLYNYRIRTRSLSHNLKDHFLSQLISRLLISKYLILQNRDKNYIDLLNKSLIFLIVDHREYMFRFLDFKDLLLVRKILKKYSKVVNLLFHPSNGLIKKKYKIYYFLKTSTWISVIIIRFLYERIFKFFRVSFDKIKYLFVEKEIIESFK